MIKGKCNVTGCQADIAPAETQAQFNRNLGLHRRTVHQIPGRNYIPKSVEREAVDPQKLREAINAARRAKYQKLYREKHKKVLANGSVPAVAGNAELKFICPCCGVKIYAVRTQ